MQGVKQIKWLPLLMAITITGIAAFQLYWLRKTYEREERTLEMRTNMAFRETVIQLQVSKLKLDHINLDSVQFAGRSEFRPDRKPVSIQLHSDEKMRNLVQVLSRKAKDSVNTKFVFRERSDSGRRYKSNYRQRNRLIQFLYDVDSLQDPVTVPEIQAAYRKKHLRLESQCW